MSTSVLRRRCAQITVFVVLALDPFGWIAKGLLFFNRIYSMTQNIMNNDIDATGSQAKAGVLLSERVAIALLSSRQVHVDRKRTDRLLMTLSRFRRYMFIDPADLFLLLSFVMCSSIGRPFFNTFIVAIVAHSNITKSDSL